MTLEFATHVAPTWAPGKREGQNQQDCGSRETPTGTDVLEDDRECSWRSHEVANVTEWPHAPTRVKLLSGLMHQLG